jgi:hypothetical protein
MAHHIFTAPLVLAAEYEGGAHRLADILRVPSGTLHRWLSGRALMPVLAFSRVLEIIAQHESSRSDEPARDATTSPLTFKLNRTMARCARCQGVEFLHCTPALKLRYSALLACQTCGTEVVHSDVLLELVRLHARHGATRRAPAGRALRAAHAAVSQ